MNSLAKIICTAKAFIASGELFDADLCLDLALKEITATTDEVDSLRTELAHMRDTDAIQDRQALLENVAALQARLETCEHEVVDGDWCEPCNVAMKEARISPENGNGE